MRSGSYMEHHHRSLAMSPRDALGDRTPLRAVSLEGLVDAFRLRKTLKTHPKTGEVDIAGKTFLVPAELRGQRLVFVVDPDPDVSPLVVEPILSDRCPSNAPRSVLAMSRRRRPGLAMGTRSLADALRRLAGQAPPGRRAPGSVRTGIRMRNGSSRRTLAGRLRDLDSCPVSGRKPDDCPTTGHAAARTG
jgi:hypothetical protein